MSLPGALLLHTTRPVFLSAARNDGALGLGTRPRPGLTPLPVTQYTRSPTTSVPGSGLHTSSASRLYTPSWATMSSLHRTRASTGPPLPPSHAGRPFLLVRMAFRSRQTSSPRLLT